MKNIILLALAMFIIVGCSFRSGQNISKKIIILDTCEYIQYWTSDCNQNIEHKGNCRFCKWRRQKELEELVRQLKEN